MKSLMARSKRKTKKKFVAVTQCEKCGRSYCPAAKQEQCAKAECMALARGEVFVCQDREPGYWEKLEAA